MRTVVRTVAALFPMQPYVTCDTHRAYYVYATGVCEKQLLGRITLLGILVSGAPNQGLDSSSAEGLQGKGSPKRCVFVQTPVCASCILRMSHVLCKYHACHVYHVCLEHACDCHACRRAHACVRVAVSADTPEASANYTRLVSNSARWCFTTCRF